MKYISTRNQKNTTTFTQAVIDGLANDGGLYTPETNYQTIDLNKIINMDYISLATYILSTLIDDFSQDEIHECITNAYQSSFDNEDITPLTKCDEGWLLELWHGPTSAFKDMALTLLPHLMKAAYSKQNEDKLISILTATSGDTGKAAINGFSNVENTAITVLYPEVGVSDIQKKQMQTSIGYNVEVIAIKGNFDDCQRIVKQAITNPDILHACKNIKLSSANSINIGRLLPQVVYYFFAYQKLVIRKEITIYDPVNFVVPSGNFGNILAGYIAKQIGLPINKLICASNSNNVLTEFIRTGVYNANRKFIPTISPSMDILVSSNLERLLFMLSDHDDKLINSCMTDLKKKGEYTIPSSILDKLQQTFTAYDCDEDTCKQVIHDTYHNQNILIDPHTAVALGACRQHQQIEKDIPCIILSTASAYKFPQDVYQSITNESIETGFQAMQALHTYTNTPIPHNLSVLESLPNRFNKVIDKQDAIQTIQQHMEELNHVHN